MARSRRARQGGPREEVPFEGKGDGRHGRGDDSVVTPLQGQTQRKGRMVGPKEDLEDGCFPEQEERPLEG